MKILFVSRKYPPFIGGSEKQLSRVAQSLAAYGHDVMVFTGGDQFPFKKHREKQNLTIYYLFDPKIRLIGSVIFLFLLTLAMIIKLKSYRIVVTNYINETSAVAITTARLLGKSSCLWPSSSGENGNLSWAQHKNIGFLYIYLCQQAHCYIAQTKEFFDDAKKLLFKDTQIHVINNPITSDFLNIGLSRRHPKQINKLLWCGRLEDVKNPLMIIDMMKTLIEKKPDITCDVLGTGNLDNDFKSAIKTNHLSKNITYHGPQHDMLKYYQQDCVYILTSNSDALPNSLIEAMAAGLPIVATATSGASHLIENKHSGYLGGLNDYQAMADRIIDLCDHPGQAYLLGQNAHAQAQNRFNEQNIVALWEKALLPLNQKLTT